MRTHLITSHPIIILSFLLSQLLLSSGNLSAQEPEDREILTENLCLRTFTAYSLNSVSEDTHSPSSPPCAHSDDLKNENRVKSCYCSIEETGQSSIENWNPVILAIKGWQQLSFRTPLLNCQFEPCCSSYGIHSIQKHGVFPGILYGADRLSRCHPFAFRYYLREEDRLLNGSQSGPYFRSDHLPWLTVPLSFILPGFNKMVNGRFWDGFSMMVVTGYSGYRLLQGYDTREYRVYLSSFVFSTFYLSDIYFNILSLLQEEG